MVSQAFRLFCIVLLLAGCTTAAPDLTSLAESEATQIVQQAQATALIQNARSTANALLTPPEGATQATPVPTVMIVEPDLSAVSTAQPAAATAIPAPVEEISQTVKLLGISFGANNNLLSVQFLAPVAIVQRWQQGNMYLLDESTGQKYEEIPVMPVIGALFARPTMDGQAGYVMFTNLPVPLQTGAVVTVVLGSYRWEHISFPMQVP